MFASVQLSIKLPPKCLAWKAEQTALQAKVTAEGKVLAAKLAILQQVLKQFRAIQKIPCNKNCRMRKSLHNISCRINPRVVNIHIHLYICYNNSMPWMTSPPSLPLVCIPVSAGEECVAKVNETCVLYEPKVDECGE